jgi:hypothetical protein
MRPKLAPCKDVNPEAVSTKILSAFSQNTNLQKMPEDLRIANRSLHQKIHGPQNAVLRAV